MAVDQTIWNLSRGNLQRAGGRSNPLYSLLEMLTWDMTVWDDDFMGDQMKYDATAPGTYQSTASGAASAAAAIATGVVNGVIRLDPGTADDGRSDLSLGLHFRGDQNCVIAVRYTLEDAITSVKLEVGFTDVVSGTDAGAVNVKATPTFTATDFVGWVLDTDDNANLEGLGVAAGTAATTQEAAITPPAAGTYETLVVAVKDTRAAFFRFNADGKLTYPVAGAPTWMTGAVTATVLLTPWIFVQNRSGAQRRLLVDRLKVWQRRTVNNP